MASSNWMSQAEIRAYQGSLEMSPRGNFCDSDRNRRSEFFRQVQRERNEVRHFGMAGDLLMECGMDRNAPIERIEEAFREIAVLFIALAPLDVALGAHGLEAVVTGLIFVGIGIILFAGALINERRRHDR
jgi:hypothetical protein